MSYNTKISTFILLFALSTFFSVGLQAGNTDISTQPSNNTATIDIIPKPLNIKEVEGKKFTIKPNTTIFYEPSIISQAKYLEEIIAGSTGYDLKMVELSSSQKAEKKQINKSIRKTGSVIILSLDQLKCPKTEGYSLNVQTNQVNVIGHDASGVFYGIQSFLQLLPNEIYSNVRHRNIEWSAQPVEIEDAPNRPWRGMMLDVARYFYDKEFVKKYIDMMAMYKLNKLQFHFIDDSGWRLEIKKYPKLTEVGAWAENNANTKNTNKGANQNSTYRLGGYYTQDDIREIVAYGQVRGVEIIPEIEFPAHMLSAVVAYPWLSCTGLQHEVPGQHFISRDLLCVGKESSIQFLKDVLDETVELFPSKYINIGGDEARYDRWAECPKCRALMEKEGYTNPGQLQGWLTNVVAKMMKEKGRTVVGWEEIIMRGEVEEPVVAMIWHNLRDTINVGKKHKAVLIPATHTYFDFPESSTPGELKAATWMPPISVKKAYSMPINDYSPEKSMTLGVQACFWSDQFIHGTVLQEIPYLDENRSERYAEYLTFPRLIAISEVAWGRESERNYDNFVNRLSHHFGKLDYKHCHYRIPEPIIENLSKNNDGTFTYELKSPVEGAEIRYTTDGTYPNVHSTLYTKPVVVKDKNDFRAITVINSRHYSLPTFMAPDYSAYKKYGKFTAEWTPMQVQTVPSIMKFDCTGKISGNGDYEITFINRKGTSKMKFGALKVYKRNELIDEDVKDYVVTTEDILSTRNPNIKIYPNSAVATYTFSVDDFEAGTPFRVEIEGYGLGENNSKGLVFIRKK